VRIPPDIVLVFLKQTPVLKGCAPDVLAKLAPAMEQRSTDAGARISQPGTSAGLGFLYRGRATVRFVNAASGSDVPTEELAPGDVFGEVGLLLGGHSPFAVVAEEACQTLHLRKEHAEQVLNVVPSVTAALARKLSSAYVKQTVLGMRTASVARGFTDPAPAPAPAPAAAPAATTPALASGEARFVDVGQYELRREVLDMLPARLIQEQRLLPLQLSGKKLLIGMVNPFSVAAKQEVRRLLHSVDPEYVAISQDDLYQAIVRLKLDVRAEKQQGGQRAPQQRPSYFAEQKKEAEKAQIIIGDEVVNLLDRILLDGVDAGASEIHIEPEATVMRVRYRIQGVLTDRRDVVPLSFAHPLIARLKVLAELDITNRQLPQDGRLVAQVGRGRELNFRVSVMPIARGEKVVVRVLDPSDVMRPLEQIFLEARGADLVKAAIAAPHGAIVIAGPSGSGKSSTLYSLLNQRKLQRPDHNILTVEDPVEYLMAGVTQVSISHRAGFDFPAAIRALMRQDPDVIMIGELRDAPSAAITLEAALTGHLLLTSLHASSAVGVLQRLHHFGLDHALTAQALHTIVVQKLVRRLCPACVREEEVAPALAETLAERGLCAKGGQVRLPRAVGCDDCDQTGFRGRMVVTEVLALDDELRSAMAAGAPPAELVSFASPRALVSFAQTAKLLMARRMMSVPDALMTVVS